ncbi:hypothetical protein RWH44_11990 [Microbacterium sp. KSW2-29]|uniref:DUF916 domain-containing protein n=1 Tax=Microbacterium phycohabitans TaxID=3075993 RepID=A0ABU3SNP4_9MICO|nr:hypothetical protein [Microbacterium sp. KSW2-29]MDU0346418.1 hypothetical protein [Microbacterium sp. KSW2-29]
MLSSTSRRRFPALGAASIATAAIAALLCFPTVASAASAPGAASAPAIAAPASASPSILAAEGDAATVGVATRPAGEDGRPDGRSRFTFAADPGQSVTDRVLVGNTGTARQDFTVYATDAFNDDAGEFSLLPTATAPTSVGRWIRFDDGSDRATFSLEPQEVRLLTFTVAVPADATPGDHVGGVVASVIESGAQVTVDRRVATAIFARVSGDLQPQLSLTSYDASYEGEWWNPFSGSVRLRYTVTNPGNIALAANLTSGVGTWFGIPTTGEQGGGVPVLLPGNSASYDYTVDGVGQWLYLNPHTVLNPFVESPDPSMQLTMVPITRDAVTFAVPWTVLIAVVLAATVILLMRWRRRRDEERAQEWMDFVARTAADDAAALVGARADGS